MNSSTSMLVISTNPDTNISAYVDESTGEAFMTDSLICDILGIHHQSLDAIVNKQGVRNYVDKYPQVLTIGGLQGVRSLRKASDLRIVLKAWNPTSEASKERKESIQDQLMEAGAIAYVYNLCGYSMAVKSNASTEIFSEAAIVLQSYGLRIASLESMITSLLQNNSRLLNIVEDQAARLEMQENEIDLLKNLPRRSGEEIRMAIAEILDDPEREHFSNIKIAAICRCSESMVRKFKDERNGKFRDDDNNFEVQVKVKIPNPWKK